MSEFTLSVGASYEERRRKLCAAHLQDAGFQHTDIEQALQLRAPVKEFLLLNVATMCLFQDYIAELTGRSTNELAQDAAFVNLPYWEDVLWAPLEFPAKAFPDDPDGPFFFGSSPGLLATLNHIKSISRIPLGPAPQGYDLMTTDMKNFYRSFDGLKDDQSCIQWVWRGLHDGASLAVKQKVPMLGNGL